MGARRKGTGPELETPRSRTARGTHAEAWTEAPDLPPGGCRRLRPPELPVEQAPVPPRPARPGPPPAVGVPHQAAREAEAPRDVRRGRGTVPTLLPRGEPAEGRDRHRAPPPAGDAPGRGRSPARLRPDDAAGAPTRLARALPAGRQARERPERQGPRGGERAVDAVGEELPVDPRGDGGHARAAALP